MLEEEGIGCIGFSALAQGVLTARYLHGVPADSRANRDGSLDRQWLTQETLAKVRALTEVASARGQTLAQLAIAWTLRDPRVTSALIGASSHDAIQRQHLDDDDLRHGAPFIARPTTLCFP